MAPEAIRSAAPAIPYKDRRGSDAPLMLPRNAITWPPPSGFNGVCNKMVSTARRRRAPDGSVRAIPGRADRADRGRMISLRRVGGTAGAAVDPGQGGQG